jgi:hypothetical protein
LGKFFGGGRMARHLMKMKLITKGGTVIITKGLAMAKSNTFGNGLSKMAVTNKLFSSRGELTKSFSL